MAPLEGAVSTPMDLLSAPIGAIEEAGRGQFETEALKLRNEGVNVKVRHGEGRTAEW